MICSENLGRLLDFGGWMLVTCTPAGYPLKWFKKIVEGRRYRLGTVHSQVQSSVLPVVH